MILTLLIAFFSLIILMIVHEFGHFIIAKKFGVKVEEFGIGYPPKIFGVKLGETVYSLNLIPLGAFVRIYGEDGQDNGGAGNRSSFAVLADENRSFSNLSIWKRILIVLGGVIAFWVAAAVLFSISFLIGATAPVGDQNVPGINDTKIQIVEVVKNSPAESAGLKPGDEITGVSSVEPVNSGTAPETKQFNSVNKVSDFQNFIQASKGKKVALQINRNGNIFTVDISPRVSYPAGQGPTGISVERIANLIKKYPWYEAPWQGIIYTGKITWEALVGIYGFFASLFSGKGVPNGAELAGPVGITIFLSRAVEYGAGFFFYFVGSLTVLLAIFNLFPIPALDGGKLLFLIIEKIKKRPVSEKIEQRLTVVFFILLIAMSLFVTVKFDVPRVVQFWQAGI